ncbi:protein-tyrosine phosphatase [Aphelenchoides avenae]|nr:protein-tyrosine phosphatase [Aphelenchus avenae]
MQNTETTVHAQSVAMHAFVKNICGENPKEKVAHIRKEFRGKVCKAVFDGSKNAYYENYELNRYSNIYLWDATRVRIREPVANEYVHASYVEDPSGRLRLIASQGPLPHTVADFWQMVFEHDASVVVQLCDFVENGWPKTEPYLMDSTFGDLTVRIAGSDNPSPSLTHTSIELKRKDTCRHVQHVMYREWPDHSIPTSLQPFTDIWDLICRHAVNGNVVVHCAGGVGRTGSFISSVLSYSLLDSNKHCEIAEVVRAVRSQRMHSVETDLQYLFVYRLTLELCVHANPSLMNSQMKRFFAEYEKLALAESQVSHDYITWDRKSMFFGE